MRPSASSSMLLRGYPSEARTLLGAQLVFNLGFYAVVPFLAGAMAGEYGMGAAAIGLVLGARTFSQQGMFLLGGMLADRWGARRSILTGCLVRISGYATLVWAADFPLFLAGAVLTGAGGALFSPALEARLSHADRSGAPAAGRRSVFVWLAITGEIGAVAGPVIGSALLGRGLDAALAGGIAVFAVVTLLLWWRLPATSRPDSSGGPAGRSHRAGEPERRRVPRCLRHRRFVTFCALASVNLLAYNQLYFAIPVELNRRGLDPAWLGGLFLLASMLTLVLQLPVAALTRRAGAGPTLSAGFGLLGVSFAVLATTAVHPAPAITTAAEAVLPVAVAVAVLILGRMMLSPTLLALVPSFVPDEETGRGAYYGLLSTCGGVAVLAGNAVLGRALDLTDLHGWWPGTPWMPLVLLAGVAAATLPQVLRGNRTGPLPEPPSPTTATDKTA